MGKGKLPTGVRSAIPGRVRVDLFIREPVKKCIYGGTYPHTPEGVRQAAARVEQLRAKYRPKES